MSSQFDEFFEDLFSEAMAYDGKPAARDRQFVHYVLGKTYERRERAWQETSRELVDYVQEKTSFVFGEKTGFGIVRISYTYAVIRWDKEIFWKEIDPTECSFVIEEAKNNRRFADVTVLPIVLSEKVGGLDQEIESSEVHEVVFGQVYIDRCLSKVKQLLRDPSFVPHRFYEGNSVWFESEDLARQISNLSEEEVKKLHVDSNERTSGDVNLWRFKGDVGYLVTGVFSAQLSFIVRRNKSHRFIFEVPSRHRKELLEFARRHNAYIPTMESQDNVSVPVSLDNLLRADNGDTKL